MKDITVEELINSGHYIPVDVRSPIEHEEANIPGSINVPLFSNDERAEIGIIYKNMGPEAAKWRAMEIVSPKLPELLGTIKDLGKNGRQPVIHCWRGGTRSQSVSAFLEYAGLPATRLSGGYRAYREYILEQIPRLLPKHAVVIHGLTGTGKTELLKELEWKGYPVLNLEEMANHRGSIFGAMGIGEGNNQKTFDALLFKRLLEIKGSQYFIIEAESKRIGRAVQQEELLERKANGIHFLIESTITSRIDRIYDEYVLPYENESWFHEEVREKTVRLEKRLKNPELARILAQAVDMHDYKLVIHILLEHYYDPRYGHKLNEYHGPFAIIPGDDIENAVFMLENEINKLINGKSLV
ncbi:tRNA 2-selenouridine(34) synthase MnmH [Bacillus sp. T33-2]|uniref:tRNA 2-selenouridine(34) synthase MnmH n=1 Tax=Bacillus sp. T33-2 TaxID=2054168 RepID=UPI000C7920E0|nr:tRNA 2-selenouridine(34) synthase MnmH [Bacillus sp. T33-2]PLR98808.1 tRNA 2-selenouridine(34) synthase MnmH [Bacillus sp. T33-2]